MQAQEDAGTAPGGRGWDFLADLTSLSALAIRSRSDNDSGIGQARCIPRQPRGISSMCMQACLGVALKAALLALVVSLGCTKVCEVLMPLGCTLQQRCFDTTLYVCSAQHSRQAEVH